MIESGVTKLNGKMDNWNMIMYIPWIKLMIISKANFYKSSVWRKEGWYFCCWLMNYNKRQKIEHMKNIIDEEKKYVSK